MKPGDATTISVAFTMHEGMQGPHTFAITIKSNDAVEPEKVVNVKADFVS